jgi:hypothetical protein
MDISSPLIQNLRILNGREPHLTAAEVDRSQSALPLLSPHAQSRGRSTPQEKIRRFAAERGREGGLIKVRHPIEDAAY